MTQFTDTIESSDDWKQEWRVVGMDELKEMYADSVKLGGYAQSFELWLIEIVTHGDFIKSDGVYYLER